MTVQLRDYQIECIDAIRSAHMRGIRRPAIVLPTGAGKTTVFGKYGADLARLDCRVVAMAHRDELIEQAASRFRRLAPDLRVGIFQASRREVRGRDIVIASVQTLARANRRAELAAAGFGLAIVDEAHHATASTYMETLKALGCFGEDPTRGAYALGVTATMGRSDRVALGQVWEEVVYARGIVQMIREGYLVPVKGVRVRVAGLDLRSVKRTGGDFAEGALAEAMHEAMAPAAIARAYVEHAKGELAVLFAPTVAFAYECAGALRELGVRAVGVDGTTDKADRRRILAEHSRGEIEVVCNCSVLTEGWDAPWCSVAIIARPTQATGLYVQMAGRVLRPAPGKERALIIDVVGVASRHRLASLVDLGGTDRTEKLDADLAAYEPDAEVDLLGLLEPEKRGTGSAPIKPGLDGDLTSELIELFGASARVWLRTPRGVWFIPAGDDLIFLAPDLERGRYLVGSVPQDGGAGHAVTSAPTDLETAMTAGERHAAGLAVGVLNKRGAAWRDTPPTPGQVGRAKRLHLPTDGLSKGEISDAISVALAGQRIDFMPCVATVSEGGYW